MILFEAASFFLILLFNFVNKNAASFVEYKKQEITVASWNTFSSIQNVK